MADDQVETLTKRLVELEATISELKGKGIAEIKKRPEVENALLWGGIFFGIPAILKRPWILAIWGAYYFLKKKAAEAQTNS